MDNEHKLIEKLEEIRVLLSSLIDSTDHTNHILKQGIKTQYGHGIHTLEMDPDRFRKSEEARQKTKPPGTKNA